MYIKNIRQEAFYHHPREEPKHDPCYHHHNALEGRIGVSQQLLEVSLEPCTRLRRRLQRIGETAMGVISSSGRIGSSLKYFVSFVLMSVLKGSCRSDRHTSHSPPGLTHTNASSSEFPVLVVGRTPNPVPMTLHQSPHAFCLVGWTPLRADKYVSG